MFQPISHEKNTVLSRLNLIHLGLITSIFIFSACKTGVLVTEMPSASFSVEKLLVLPFKDLARVYGENVNVRCPLCGRVFMTGKTAQGADDMLTENLIILLKNRGDFKLVPTIHAQRFMSDLLSGNETKLSEHDLLVETGRAFNADAVIAGNVYRFRERIGTKYSVDSPASVAFGIHLISVTNGRIIWSGYFDETQRPLSENLFHLGTFLKRKASWITSQEMALSGLKDMLQSFPEP